MNIMHALSLKSAYDRVNDISLRITFYSSQFLTNEHFLDLPICRKKSGLPLKIITAANKSKKAIQRKALEALTQKSHSGDIAPKPTMNVAMGIAREAFYVASKATPILSKGIANPASIAVMFGACSLLVLVDETSRNMIVDQVSQWMALFQNETGKTNAPKETKTSEISTAGDDKYEKPNYFL